MRTAGCCLCASPGLRARPGLSSNNDHDLRAARSLSMDLPGAWPANRRMMFQTDVSFSRENG